jgi:hypothetical protein
MATFKKLNEHILYYDIKGKLAYNKSIFINIIPYESKFKKSIISNKLALIKLLFIPLLVFITLKDFLKIFSKKL